MKLTKFFKSKVLVLAVLFGGALLLQNCSKDDDPAVVINKTTLQTAITTATTTHSAAVEGTAQGQFTYGSKAKLQTAIDLATGVLNTVGVTQIQIDNTVISLNAAMATFTASAIVPIDPTNLVGHWTFNDGTGTTVKDFSGNNFTGTFGFVAGWLGANPTWTTDRYGVANRAIAFDKGAKITIPYNTKLNPTNMTISVWIKIAEQRNNRFMGLHSWNGFKWEVQDGMKSFLTAATTANGIHDRDFAGANPLVINTWYHLTVAFGNGRTTFYVNGTMVQDWDNTPGTLAVVTGHDLVFGVDSSKYAATATNYDVDKIIPLDWGNYLKGTLDEVRIYKSILTASQVKSIYDTEKVPN